MMNAMDAHPDCSAEAHIDAFRDRLRDMEQEVMELQVLAEAIPLTDSDRWRYSFQLAWLRGGLSAINQTKPQEPTHAR